MGTAGLLGQRGPEEGRSRDAPDRPVRALVGARQVLRDYGADTGEDEDGSAEGPALPLGERGIGAALAAVRTVCHAL